MVFENLASSYASKVHVKLELPREIEIYSGRVSCYWHSRWNALGDGFIQEHERAMFEEKSYVPTRHADGIIKSEAEFSQAMEFCKNFEGRGIAFFDMDLGLQDMDVARFVPEGNSLLKLILREKGIDYLNSNEGLVLASSLALNRKADVDIVFATSGNPPAIDIFTGHKSPNVINVYSCGGSLVKQSAEDTDERVIDTFVTRFKESINKYQESREFDTDVTSRLWPTTANDWFRD